MPKNQQFLATNSMCGLISALQEMPQMRQEYGEMYHVESNRGSSLHQVTDFLRMLHQRSKQLCISYWEFYRPDLHGITQMSAGFQGYSFVCSKSRRANPSAFLSRFAKSPEKVWIPNTSHSSCNSDISD